MNGYSTPARLVSSSRLAAVPDRRGLRIGTWSVEAVLAVGGSAVVYRASDGFSNPIALKVLHRHLVESDSAVERFHQEARIVSDLAHPAIPKLLETGKTSDGLPFQAMELLDGESLDVWLKRGSRFDSRLVVQILLAVLDVLEKTHELHILHRDIKPSNVLLTGSGQVKLLDFGVARVRGSSELTGVGIAVGTPAYMPPEQALGLPKDVGPASDLFSLGLTALSLLNGSPVRSRIGAELSLALVPIPSCAELGLEISSALASVLERAVRVRVEERYGSAREMRLDLLNAMLAEPLAAIDGPVVDDETLTYSSATASDVRLKWAEDASETVHDVDVTRTIPASPISSSASQQVGSLTQARQDAVGEYGFAEILSAFSEGMSSQLSVIDTRWKVLALVIVYLATFGVAVAGFSGVREERGAPVAVPCIGR